MKVVFLVRFIDYGGITKMMSYYTEIAREIYDEVHIVVIDDVSNDSLKYPSDIIIDEIGNNNSRKNKLKAVLSDIKSIKKTVYRINPDIVIPFGSGNTVYAYLALKNKYYFVGTERENPEERSTLLKIICKLIYRKCDYLLFQSQGVADYYGLPKGKYKIIPNPCVVSTEYRNRFHVRSKDKLRIISLSRLSPEKNIDIIVEAIAKCKCRDCFEAYFFGNGILEKELVNKAKELKISEKIFIMGTTDNPMEELIKSDIFVLVSNGEGMPNALIEAMSLGVPCITTKCMCGDTNSLVTHMHNGIVVEKRDEISLANALDLLASDIELYHKISNNALGIREELSDERISTEIKSMFLELKQEKDN